MSEYGSITLQVRKNSGKGAARTLRRAQRAPGIVYGGGQDNVSISFSPLELFKATDPDRQGNTLFTATLEDDGKKVGETTCMLAEIQRHPLKNQFLHVDFMRVDLDKEIVRTVPVVYEGKAEGVAKGGRLKTFLKAVKVSSKPADVPTSVVINVTPLDAGDTLRVSDVQLPGVTLVAKAHQPLALVEQPKAATESDGDEEGAAAPADAEAKK